MSWQHAIEYCAGRVKAGRVRKVWCWQGHRGVGKTRLAREALATAEAAGCAPWWVVASRAAASIPFGAVAHVVPPVLDGGMDRFAVLQRAGDWLTASASGRRPVLGIDDAHWLDDGSAALIHHLTLTGVASVVVTVRLGEPAPDPVTALWKEGLAERIDVAALCRAQSAALVEAGLGGPVDGLTVERLWQFSQGNALYLRELVRGWAESGALACTDRVWRWQGPILAPARLVELLEARIGKEPVPVRQLAELVAFGEPLDVEALQQVGIDPTIVQAAEDAGLLCSESIGAGIQVRLAHPLYGEVLRMRTSPLRARAVYASLSRTLTSVGATQPNAALRLAVWHLNAGLRCEPDVLVAGSSAALAGFDYRLAERLARSAIVAGGGMAANQALAETLVAEGQAEQAEAIFVGLPLDGVTDQVRAAVARTRVLNLHWGLGRPVDAEAVLSETEAEIADPACRDELACLRAKFLQHAGQCADAIELANKILARPKATEAAVSTSLAVRAQALTALGQYDQSVDAAQRGVEFERKRNNGLWSLAEDEVVSGSFIGYLWAGQLAPAEAVARSCYQRAVAMSWPMGTAAWAMWLGEIERARGRLTDALRWFREAAAVARGDAFRHPYWSFLDRHVLARGRRRVGWCWRARPVIPGVPGLLLRIGPRLDCGGQGGNHGRDRACAQRSRGRAAPRPRRVRDHRVARCGPVGSTGPSRAAPGGAGHGGGGPVGPALCHPRRCTGRWGRYPTRRGRRGVR